MMNGSGKSYGPIVPTKPPNKGEPRRGRGQGEPYAGTKAETPETAKGRDLPRGNPGRRSRRRRWRETSPAKGNADQQNTPRTQRRKGVPSALDRVRQAARRNREEKFTALLHHVTVERLRTAFHALNKAAAAGVDGVTWHQYEENLEENLRELHERVHRGAYRAKPSRRTYIPKADGRQRPLGIATVEDKVIQRAVVEVLNAIYEEDFLGFSYGMRPGRNQHQALDALAYAIKYEKVNYVLDADIRGFYDAIDHEWLVKFVEHRIGDHRVVRLIQKWLKAGVIEAESWAASREGTPQGATVSPLLANIYLHYVLDLWANQWRDQHARGTMCIVRYADDFTVGFQHRDDAKRFLAELRERLGKFALELHPEKTRLLEFGRYAAERREKRGHGKPETFDFLGFTHICGCGSNGDFVLVRHTIRTRLSRKLQEIRTELLRRRHAGIPAQGAWLRQVVNGYLNYHAVPTNSRAIRAFRREVSRAWLYVLRRRSQKDRTTWRRMQSRIKRWLPPAKIRHPWPDERFDRRTRGRNPVR